MAEGLINVNNAVAEEQLAQQYLDNEFTRGIRAAGDEAEDLPGLGQRLQREWAELMKVASQLPELNGAIAGEVATAHKIMTGGEGSDYGVAHHVQDIFQGPQGNQTPTRRARVALHATVQLAMLTPEETQWRHAREASDAAQKRFAALGSLVANVVTSTSKVSKDRFDDLKSQTKDASQDLQKHMNKL